MSLYHPIQLIQYPKITEDDNILLNNSTEKYTASTSAAKLKETRVYVRGTIRTYFEMRASSASYTVYCAVYRNGNIVGANRNTTSTTYVYFTEDVPNWLEGDYYQLYGYTTNASYPCYVRNQQIRGKLSTEKLVGLALL
jgi:hypothetical protein